MPFYDTPIIERRALGALIYLTLGSPELARTARPGQYLLARCAPTDSADPLLRRPLFFADADQDAGTVGLLLAPDDRGLRWLAAQPVGARIDLFGPLGSSFELDGRARTLVLAGAGPALPALIFLARHAEPRGLAAVLLAAAPTADQLPPPFLLPSAVEYQSSDEGERGLLDLLGSSVGPGRLSNPAAQPLVWADQLCLAISPEQLAPTAAAVRASRLRWERGFAQVVLAGPIPCGTGACQVCLVETRNGLRARCKDGPVFDLRELRL